MASLVLTVAGSSLGNALVPGVGGAVLGGIGAMLGGQIDSAMFGNGTVAGPRLDSLKIQDSTYGKSIPVIYGNARVAGNVIWASDLIETLSSDHVGGKGGGSGGSSVQRASYSVDCAIALGMGALDSIRTIWADSKVIYSGGQWHANIVTDAEFYMGSDTQPVSSLMEGYLGVGNVPAYRGISYVVLHRLQLAHFGNRMPNVTFECVSSDSPVSPMFLGETNPVIGSRPQTIASFGAMPAIPLARKGSAITRMLVGGVLQTGMLFQFVVLEMDVTGDIPVEMRRTLSQSVSRLSDLADVSWALSPQGDCVACVMQHYDAGNPVMVALYHLSGHVFGTAITESLGYSSALNQIAWLDEQHFVMQDAVSGQRGVRVYARAGLTPVALGFFGVWGVGSDATRQPLPFAQFCVLSGGLCSIMGDAMTMPHVLYARMLCWRNQGLEIYDEALVSDALAGFPSTHAAILPINAHEFVLARTGTSEIRLISFTANFNTVAVTRNWSSVVVSPSGNVSISIKDGRLSFIHAPFSTSEYYYGEIAPTAEGFSVSSPSRLVAGEYDGVVNNVSFYPVDSTRFLMQACGSSGMLRRLAMVQRGDACQSLGVIVTDILNRAGYAAADYDVGALNSDMNFPRVQGYVIDNASSARAALEPLQIVQPFDLIETDGILKTKPYSAAIDVWVDSAQARAAFEQQEQPALLQTTRGQELDLPREISVDYLDPALDFQRGTQRAARIISSACAVETIALPVVCAADTAKHIARRQITSRWVERDAYELYVSRAFMGMDAGDVMTVAGHMLRVTQIDQHGGLLKVLAVPVSDQMLSFTARADAGIGMIRNELECVASTLFVLDIPLLRPADDQPGYLVGITGSAAWPGAMLARSTDGVNYAIQDSFSLPVTAGLASSVLQARSTYYMDRESAVTIALLRGSLSSCSMEDLLNGANAALLGDELIQFQNASLNVDGTLTLSHLLRGRKGSEASVGTHRVGERFLLLQSHTVRFMPLNTSDRGRRFYFRAASVGQDLHDVADTVFVPQMNHLKPLAPAHLMASRNDSADIILTWTRRARKDNEWVDAIDVPLDEDDEAYDVEVLRGDEVTRCFLNQPSATITYTAAQQVEDFGAPQSMVTFQVYQLGSRIGRGNVAQATV